ncbi:MAG: DUF1801 domain-containing protein [Coriobacteriia bacterium]|nr:DUF1801 domain-containing protein [Coriobacteriia bacterium]
MTETSVEQHLDRLRADKPAFFEIVQAVCTVVESVAPDVSEKVMYGGILFSAPIQFCGVFAYAQHVSVEFGRGFELDDELGVLEGGGKLRRHIRLTQLHDVERMGIRGYVAQSYALMRVE